MGLRVGKVDSTGTYSYLCDGASPGAPVLSDGHAVYTPGLSENRGGTVSYPLFDRIGNLWTQDGAGKSQSFYQDFTGFGSLTALGGGNASPFRFGGALGCQTDADTGLVLMGHRYFDPRTGRFITQDPAGDGDNWYSYADNSPVNAVDPDGLMSAPTPGAWSIGGGTSSDASSAWSGFGYGNAAGGTPVYNAVFTADKTTGQIVNVLITGLAATIGGNLNVVTYEGFTPAEAKKITHILNVINTTKRGHQLVNKVRKSPRKYRIIKNKTNNAGGLALTGVMYFNFGIKINIHTVDGLVPATPTRILAHELGHMSGGQLDDGPGNMNNVNVNENPVMIELDDIGAARTTYP